MKPGEKFIMVMGARTKFEKYHPVFVHQNIVDQDIQLSSRTCSKAVYKPV
jgi:ATP-dependent Clp protease ATP-binding subunit ClpA